MPSEWARLPSAQLCIHGGFIANLFGVLANKISMESVKAEERRAAGRRFGPEAVTEQAAGLLWETPARTEATLLFPLMPFTGNPDSLLPTGPPTKSRVPPPHPLVFCSA